MAGSEQRGRRKAAGRHRGDRSGGTLRPLGELRPWESCIVDRVEGEWRLRRRLAELGFLPGTPVQVGRMAPMGDPIELRIRGYRMTLSREQALRIWVLPQRTGGEGAVSAGRGTQRGRPKGQGGGQGRWQL